MNIVTLGNGFLAQHLPYPINDEKLATDNQSDLFFTLDSIHRATKADVVINCIGKTGRPNIDECESQKEATYHTNTILPLMIAEWCQFRKVRLINIGSGCIFSGPSNNFHYGTDVQFNVARGYIPCTDLGWKESDPANPVSYYSRTKYACDLLMEPMPNVVTLRIRMPISSQNVPRNLLSKLKTYSKVIDEPNSITSMDDLVRCIDWAAKSNLSGVYHVTNPQPTTAVQIMQEYQKYHPQHKFEAIMAEELDKMTLAKRSNCILNTDKLTKAGFTMTPTKEAVEKAVKEYVANGG